MGQNIMLAKDYYKELESSDFCETSDAAKELAVAILDHLTLIYGETQFDDLLLNVNNDIDFEFHMGNYVLNIETHGDTKAYWAFFWQELPNKRGCSKIGVLKSKDSRGHSIGTVEKFIDLFLSGDLTGLKKYVTIRA